MRNKRILKVVSVEGLPCCIPSWIIVEEGNWQGSVAADGTKLRPYWPSGHYEAFILDPALVVEVEEGSYEVCSLLSPLYQIGLTEKKVVFSEFEAACPEWKYGKIWHNLELRDRTKCYVTFGKREELIAIQDNWCKALVRAGDQNFFTNFELAYEFYSLAFNCCQEIYEDEQVFDRKKKEAGRLAIRKTVLELQWGNAYRYEKMVRLFMLGLDVTYGWPVEVAKHWSAIRLIKDIEEGKWKKEIEEKIMEDPRTKGFEFFLKK